MLVLSRKEAQRIRLGDSIMITVVRVSGDKVRLGIQAPREMLVLRDELEPLEAEPLEAASRPGDVVQTLSVGEHTDEEAVLSRSA